ncbi:exopolysaccharide biosynthesis polyprenyl glycosylphosphotransferase [Flavobacterium ovatum]|uniref:exopolysaccharide biosynthesis polyprenyl glycosylphosphotransferase n=1 Tax=Flavobacterium ovatum TaxID=1928857 RepID=UPI00344B1A4C
MTKGRYSGYIRPFTYFIDLILINLLFYYCIESKIELISHFFITFSWLIISWNIGYYEVYRFTKPLEIVSKIFNQFLIFTILIFAYAGYMVENVSISKSFKYVVLVIALTAVLKLFVYYFLQFFRRFLGGNFRKVIVIGSGEEIKELIQFFNENIDYGYKIVNIFYVNKDSNLQIQKALQYVLNNYIDEIYCSLVDLEVKDVILLEDFADKNLKTLKYIPDSKNILLNNINYDYLGYIPLIPMRDIPLDNPRNYILKRVFDIIFSLFMIVFVLSWLTIILTILIKLETKGPVFFKQKRNGINYKVFICYKFRSLYVNKSSDTELVTKFDKRITKIGKIIRKTNIDEMPQFFNVLLGDMSIVGPRPQMISVNEDYLQRIDKFMVRHFIKPGITGLAQVSGFRGEIESNEDIVNRVKFDVFYVEKWSFLLDLKIIFSTIVCTLVGDKKAY